MWAVFLGGNFISLSGTDDLNNVTSGIYHAVPSTINSPSFGNSHSMILSFIRDNRFMGFQIAFSQFNTAYYRILWNSDWQSWEQIQIAS